MKIEDISNVVSLMSDELGVVLLDWKKKEMINNIVMKMVSEQKEEWPQGGDVYWCIHGSKVSDFYYTGEWDAKNKALNNVFRTKEEAERKLKRNLAIAELERMCDGGQWFLFRTEKYWCATMEYRDTINSPYRFSTEEKAKESIKTLGEEKLKLIFNVEK